MIEDRLREFEAVRNRLVELGGDLGADEFRRTLAAYRVKEPKDFRSIDDATAAYQLLKRIGDEWVKKAPTAKPTSTPAPGQERTP